MFSPRNKFTLGTILCILLISNVMYFMLYVMESYTKTIGRDHHVVDSRSVNKVIHLKKLEMTSASIDTDETTERLATVSAFSESSLKHVSTFTPFSITDEQTSCKVKTDWNQFLPNPSITTDLTNWNFTETVNCMYETILDAEHSKTVLNFSFNCSDKYSPDVYTLYNKNNGVKTNSDIQVVQFGDMCLLKFIESCCYDSFRVPNVVHYVRYRKWRLTFFELVSFYSVIRFVRPCAILIHGDYLPTGSYWDHILAIFPNIVHVRRTPPMFIAGVKRGFPEHSGDIMRIEALILYGGIYLDLDTVFVKPIATLRPFPCTMSAQSSGYISSAFIASERNSSFVYQWLQGYKTNYKSFSYTYNAMTYPKTLSRKFPSDIHVLHGSLSRPWYQIGRVVYDTNYEWGSIYGIHLFSRSFNRFMDEEQVKIFNSTVGSICRHVLYGNKQLCRK